MPFARRSRRRCGVQRWAFRSTAASLANGLDIEMPNGVFFTEDKIQAAIENKTITMAVRARARVCAWELARMRACVYHVTGNRGRYPPGTPGTPRVQRRPRRAFRTSTRRACASSPATSPSRPRAATRAAAVCASTATSARPTTRHSRGSSRRCRRWAPRRTRAYCGSRGYSGVLGE